MRADYINDIVSTISKDTYFKSNGELRHHSLLVEDCTDTTIAITNKIKKELHDKVSFYELRVEKIITNDGKRHILSIWYIAAHLPKVDD